MMQFSIQFLTDDFYLSSENKMVLEYDTAVNREGLAVDRLKILMWGDYSTNIENINKLIWFTDYLKQKERLPQLDECYFRKSSDGNDWYRSKIKEISVEIGNLSLDRLARKFDIIVLVTREPYWEKETFSPLPLQRDDMEEPTDDWIELRNILDIENSIYNYVRIADNKKFLDSPIKLEIRNNSTEGIISVLVSSNTFASYSNYLFLDSNEAEGGLVLPDPPNPSNFCRGTYREIQANTNKTVKLKWTLNEQDLAGLKGLPFLVLVRFVEPSSTNNLKMSFSLENNSAILQETETVRSSGEEIQIIGTLNFPNIFGEVLNNELDNYYLCFYAWGNEATFGIDYVRLLPTNLRRVDVNGLNLGYGNILCVNEYEMNSFNITQSNRIFSPNVIFGEPIFFSPGRNTRLDFLVFSSNHIGHLFSVKAYYRERFALI